jgi:hypothetical protein
MLPVSTFNQQMLTDYCPVLRSFWADSKLHPRRLRAGQISMQETSLAKAVGYGFLTLCPN